jgi:predicted Zn-dependent protease
MRENETLPAVLAFLGGLVILAGALAAYLAFVHKDTDGSNGDCLNPNACREATPEFAAAYSDVRACEGREQRVCLVPLGEVPKDLVDHLVAYYRDEYDLTLHVLPAVELEPGFDSDRPGQLAAEYLQVMYTDAYGQYVGDPNVLLIGLTAIDIYTPDKPQWRWFFGYLDDRSAVISSFRMEPENWGKRTNDALRNRRVRTLMNKYIAMGYYGLPLNDDRHSVLFRLIGGLDILDGIDERIPVPK